MSKEKLSKKELNTLYHRYMMWYNAGSSYERYHGMGYGYALIPLFKKYYDRQGQIEGLQRHTDMHNTEMQVGSLIFGITTGLGEQKALGKDVDDELIKTTKIGLMGPVAGIGDAMVQGVMIPILLSIGVALAQGGNPLGPIFYMIAYPLIIFLGCRFLFNTGYHLGIDAVNLFLGETAKRITEAITLLGVILMGGIAASYIKFTTKLVIPRGEDVVEVQSILDGIFPKLIPLLLVFAVYGIMSKKKVSTVRMILLLMLFTFVLAFFHII